jgi:hypothetical protein
MAWRGKASPKLFARSLAIFYSALAVMGLIRGINTLFGLLPLHGHDVWLHAGTAAIAAYFGWRAEFRSSAAPLARPTAGSSCSPSGASAGSARTIGG